MKNLTFEDMSSCARTHEHCESGRKRLEVNMAYGECLEQSGAACFTFTSVVQGTDSFDCSATVAACERQRQYALGRPRDFESVSPCGIAH